MIDRKDLELLMEKREMLSMQQLNNLKTGKVRLGIFSNGFNNSFLCLIDKNGNSINEELFQPQVAGIDEGINWDDYTLTVVELKHLFNGGVFDIEVDSRIKVNKVSG